MKNYEKDFEALLDEYRKRNIHFVHLKTATQDLFLILNDSYYLTYRDDKKEIAISLLLRPRDKDHEALYFYNTNNRRLDEWYQDVCEEYYDFEDNQFYHHPHYEDIYINYLNEDEKVPMKDFLAVIPKTNYKIIGNYIIFDEIAEGLTKEKKSYKVGQDDTMSAQIKYWLHFNDEDIQGFNYVPYSPQKPGTTLNLDALEMIIPAHTNVRFIFDNGSVKVLKEILKRREK